MYPKPCYSYSSCPGRSQPAQIDHLQGTSDHGSHIQWRDSIYANLGHTRCVIDLFYFVCLSYVRTVTQSEHAARLVLTNSGARSIPKTDAACLVRELLMVQGRGYGDQCLDGTYERERVSLCEHSALYVCSIV